jgi:hypothetical protein
MEWDIDQPIVSTKSLHTPYGEQDENGTDLSLIRLCLKQTPLARIRIADRARRGVLKLRQDVQRQRQEPA